MLVWLFLLWVFQCWPINQISLKRLSDHDLRAQPTILRVPSENLAPPLPSEVPFSMILYIWKTCYSKKHSDGFLNSLCFPVFIKKIVHDGMCSWLCAYRELSCCSSPYPAALGSVRLTIRRKRLKPIIDGSYWAATVFTRHSSGYSIPRRLPSFLPSHGMYVSEYKTPLPRDKAFAM